MSNADAAPVTATSALVLAPLAIALLATLLVAQEDRDARGSSGLAGAVRAAAYLTAAGSTYFLLVAVGTAPHRAALTAGCIPCLAGLAETDLRWLLLPDRLVLLTAAQALWLLAPPVALLAAWPAHTEAALADATLSLAAVFTRSVAGAATGAGLLLAVRVAMKRWRGVAGLGLGDVKLAGALGLILGPLATIQAIGVGAALVLALAVALPRRLGHSRNEIAPELVFPLGAGLAASGTVSTVWALFPT